MSGKNKTRNDQMRRSLRKFTKTIRKNPKNRRPSRTKKTNNYL